MSRRGERKAESRRKTGEKRESTIIVVTNVSEDVDRSVAMDMIFRKFQEKDACSEMKCDGSLGDRVRGKRGTYVFFGNEKGDEFSRKMKMRSADINIVVVGGEMDEDAVALVKRARQENILFVSVGKENKRGFKRAFGKTKVYSLQEIERVVGEKRQFGKKGWGRPYVVVESVECKGELTIMKGVARKGLLSNKVVVNGSVICEMEELYVDGEKIDMGCVFEKKEEGRGVSGLTREIGQMQIQESSSEEERSESSFSNESEADTECEDLEKEVSLDSGEREEESSLTDSEEREDKTKTLRKVYSEYKGFKSVHVNSSKGTGLVPELKAFRESNLPEYYKHLTFVSSDLRRVRKTSTKAASPFREGAEVTIVLRGSDLGECTFEDGFLVIHGLYEHEGLNTIMTLSYSTGETISTFMSNELEIDFGFFRVPCRSMILGSGTPPVIRCKREGNSGVLCLIGPMLFAKDRVAILLQGKAIGDGTVLEYSDPILLKGVVLRGIPCKVYKRSCVVGRMFRSRKDVKYFRDVKLYTSEKKEGYVKRPLGEKGLMKCYFFPPVRHGEQVYMELFKRIFLRWRDSPRSRSMQYLSLPIE
jgi:pre-rRNA-processing protein TSR1